MKPQELSARLREIEDQGLYRRRRVLDRLSGVEVAHEGRRLLNFCSNDYLGLADHPSVVAAFRGAAPGVGSGASHLVSGHSSAHHALEEELAEFTGRERAVLFSTGYMANLGVISALAGRGDWIFEDRLNHASLLDGAALAGARLKRYRHGDVESLGGSLAECSAEGRLVVTDGVFSMDGDLAPLPELVRASRNANAWLMVDDAHGLGVIGAGGRGVLEHYALGQEDVPILVGTLGKAFGTFGAFVAGSRDLIEFLIQRARTYIYTTALPPAVAEATRASLRIIRQEPWRRDQLRGLIARFRTGASQLGLRLMDSDTPIQPIVIGSNEAATAASGALMEAGLLVSAIRPPTVPAGTARLRVTFSAAHTEGQLDRLLEVLDTLKLNAS
ncbi:8-amino-7-oxononanoate synthase [Methylococcus sp. EFPC2]|uniref:8-amino-7-oxononanoate synthase n=1 Tax=Methylococcus sp. EFPC2 TaxID=2812648 RepID=UPI001966D024|nr:8-amino-7-oxononanoate synthase [Methylococcus sp. EFPC2]QSA98773.1 8-amino-7-oxononanoate synthase [Methylococcus sp. EFPC2]